MTDPINENEVLSSGQVAAYCHVHFRTVIRWIEKGRLKAHKLPGRGNNRIMVKDFIEFLVENNMPIPQDLQQSTISAADKNSTKVLIVDDDINMGKAIQRTMKQAGFDTVIALDGFQAGFQLKKHNPALMTLDLTMPGMDGFKVLEYISAEGMLDKIKVIVVSALSGDAKIKALQLGAHAYIVKPFKNEDLLEKCNKLLEKQYAE